jgi:protein-arginine kinase activator protein McsA
MLLLKQKLKDKMLHLAESDEFEKASMVKNDINLIENKIKFIDTLEEKNITREDYFKTFCLNS